MNNPNSCICKMIPLEFSIVDELEKAFAKCKDNCKDTWKIQREKIELLNTALSVVIEKRNQAINNSIPESVLETAVAFGTGSFTVVLDPKIEKLINDSLSLLNSYFSSFTKQSYYQS